MTNCVDRCLCGYFVTQEEIDADYCPECYRPISNLTERWAEYEQLQSEEYSSQDSTSEEPS